MTTVMTDGKFMIADKQSSGRYRVRRVHNGKAKNISHPVVTRQSVKIHTPDNLFTAGLKIKAIGFAGGVSIINCLSKILCSPVYSSTSVKERPKDLTEIFNVFRGLSAYINSGFSMLCLCEDGKVITMNYTPPEKIDYERPGSFTTDVHDYSEGKIFAIGTGGSVWSHYKDFMPKDVHIRDAFHFVTHLDQNSSHDYSVYSLEEDKLIDHVSVDESGVITLVSKLQQEMNFSKGRVKKSSLEPLQEMVVEL